MIANERANHKSWETYRSEDGRARVVFHPEWSESKPWCSYIDGTAGRQYPTLLAAAATMRELYGIRIVLDAPR